jgi:hypothetical protein
MCSLKQSAQSSVWPFRPPHCQATMKVIKLGTTQDVPLRSPSSFEVCSRNILTYSWAYWGDEGFDLCGSIRSGWVGRCYMAFVSWFVGGSRVPPMRSLCEDYAQVQHERRGNDDSVVALIGQAEVNNVRT